MNERSPLDALPRPLAIAVHDAGAANMIAAWAMAANAPPDIVIADGPGRAIWERNFGKGVALTRDPAALGLAACLLSGTGWASDLEHRARVEAANADIPSIAVLDHWVNYAMRFERGGAVQWPDRFWVGDADAARLARATLPSRPLEQHPNLYLSQQARAAGPTPEHGDALFLLEPARSDWGEGAGKAGEFQALDFFMTVKERAGLTDGTPIRLRPHPSDPEGKYADWLETHPGARLDRSPDMAGALAGARWVVGLHSAGLVVALEAGRTVLCALPPHAPPCALPHQGIIRLADL